MAPAADPLARYNPRFVRGFSRYARWYVGRSFDGVRRSGPLPELPPDRPLLVYANHPSWWDPLLLLLAVQHAAPQRRAFGPIDAAALAQYPFMARLGLFGIDAGRRGAAQFLKHGERLLDDARTALVVTVQGRFTDARARPLTVLPGVVHLARRRPHAVLLPIALEYPFWDERTPEALFRFGAPHDGAGVAVDDLRARLTAAADELAAEAQSRDPDRFATVLRGRAGVGGVYDLGRRLRAALRGERFTASHRQHG